jgi:hypothetical protein
MSIGLRSILGAAVGLLVLPALAAELPSGFQGRWFALGDCTDKNVVPGALVTIGPEKLDGHEFSCSFSDIKERADGQNRQATLHRTCHSGGKDIEADVRLYLVQSEALGEVLVTVNQDGSFLTLYKRCPG